MSKVLYRKWRPLQWEEVIGQHHVVQTLRNAVMAERVAHAYLFAGPRGTGKTTMARLLAKAVNCLDSDLAVRPCNQCDHCLSINQGRFLDLIEIDAASNTSVDDVRSLRDKINFSPNAGRFKVYIIDEVHMLSTAAFNALLKTLEEPPSHAIFILATTEIHKIPATVLSRCQRHEFRRIPVNDILEHLKIIANAENIQADDEALKLISRQATGSVRDAISLLDQLASSGEAITLDMAETILGTAANQSVVEIVEAILTNDSTAGLDQIHLALDSGADSRQFTRQIVDYLRNLLLVRLGNASEVDATTEMRTQMAQHAQGFEVSDLLRLIRGFNHAANEARNTWQPSLPLEIAFVEALTSPLSGTSEDTPNRMRGSKGKRSGPGAPIDQDQGLSPGVEASTADEVGGSYASEAAVNITIINKQWKRVLALIRGKNPSTEALLKSGRLLGVKNGVLYFGFSEVLKSKMEQKEHIELVCQIFREVLETEVPIRCVVSTGKSGKLPADIDGEGMVATALRDLGGEIVDVQ
jgi:DNA polymerase-3 subunit gamma/tau